MSEGGNSSGWGWGRPGTRVGIGRGQQAETTRYVVQATIGTLAADVAITCVLLFVAAVGWLALPVLFAAMGFVIGAIIILWGRPDVIVHHIAANLWGIGLVVGLAESIWWRGWYGTFRSGILAILGVFQLAPGWAYVILAGVCLIAWVRGIPWRAIVALLGIGVASAMAYGFVENWHITRWLLVPYASPVFGFAILLSFIMVEQMLRPTVEWTVQPMTLQDIQEAGGWGALFFPALFPSSRVAELEEELAEALESAQVRTVDITVTDGNSQSRIPGLPDSDRARLFYREVAHDPSQFSVRGALDTIGRVAFEKIRDQFIERGWAYWINPRNHREGTKFRASGYKAICALAHPPTPPQEQV